MSKSSENSSVVLRKKKERSYIDGWGFLSIYVVIVVEEVVYLLGDAMYIGGKQET